MWIATVTHRRRCYTLSMFNIFKTVRLRWFEIAVFKVGLLALGVAVGAYWSDFFVDYVTALVDTAAIALIYILYVWVRQK